MSNEHHTGPGARARRALIVVDVQPTFCEGGALAVPGGDAVAGRIRRLLAMADKRAHDLGIPDTESVLTPDMLDL